MTFKNKKATTSMEMVVWVPRIIFLIIVFLSVFFLIKVFLITSIDTFETDVNIFAQRILFSKNLNFIDQETDRLYIGMIDLRKFQSKEIENKLENEIFYNQNKKISAKINLRNLDKDISYNDIFYKKALYEEKKVLTDTGLTNDPGGARSFTKQLYVLIRDKSILEKGILTIEVIMPNS